VNAPRDNRFRGLHARFGLARWDITPGLEVCAKNWGATDRWFARGVHRPLTGTALAIASFDPDAPPLILISLDLGWWRSRADANNLSRALCAALAVPEQNLIVHLAHTHAGPILDSEPPPQANPPATAAYLVRLQTLCIEGARAAVADLQPSSLLFHTGSCGLAAKRDMPDPNNPERFLTGFHPKAKADETLIVARLFDTANRTRATLVNYACHPTTLAWDNDLLSPDFPGAMREVIETSTGAPCLFLQGASGDLAPREQYSGDPALADRHGRVLGYAAMSLLAMLAEGRSDLVFAGAMESGAPLALWSTEKSPLPEEIHASTPDLDLPLKTDLPSLAEIRQNMEKNPAGFVHERLLRQLRIRDAVGEGATLCERIWVWHLGGASLFALPFEAYQVFQQEIRKAAGDRPVLVLNTSNGHIGYLPPAPLYMGRNLYTVWQTPYAEGSLEAVIRLAKEALVVCDTKKLVPDLRSCPAT